MMTRNPEQEHLSEDPIQRGRQQGRKVEQDRRRGSRGRVSKTLGVTASVIAAGALAVDKGLDRSEQASEPVVDGRPDITQAELRERVMEQVDENTTLDEYNEMIENEEISFGDK